MQVVVWRNLNIPGIAHRAGRTLDLAAGKNAQRKAQGGQCEPAGLHDVHEYDSFRYRFERRALSPQKTKRYDRQAVRPGSSDFQIPRPALPIARLGQLPTSCEVIPTGFKRLHSLRPTVFWPFQSHAKRGETSACRNQDENTSLRSRCRSTRNDSRRDKNRCHTRRSAVQLLPGLNHCMVTSARAGEFDGTSFYI